MKENLIDRFYRLGNEIETTAKWLMLFNMAKSKTAEDFLKIASSPQEKLLEKSYLLDNILWQFSRLVHEIKELAAHFNIDITHGLECLTAALSGELYKKEE